MATTEPTADEIDALRHRLMRVFAELKAPANHIVAATCFLMGIQGRHGGGATLPQVQAVACTWIERGWKAYDRWSVVEMPKELPEAPPKAPAAPRASSCSQCSALDGDWCPAAEVQGRAVRAPCTPGPKPKEGA